MLRKCTRPFRVGGAGSRDQGKNCLASAKSENPSDLYAVAVKNDAGTIVGHVPRKIKAVCSPRRGGTIVCELTGSTRAPVDPPGYFFAKWWIVAAIQFSAARFAISAFCSVVKLSIRFPPRFLCRLLFLALQKVQRRSRTMVCL